LNILTPLSKITQWGEKMSTIYRKQYDTLKARLSESPRYIQVIEGPRQVGKTTLLLQLQAAFPTRITIISAEDAGATHPHLWLSTQWKLIRQQLEDKPNTIPILCIDEIQKMPDWSAQIKALWDENRRLNRQFHVVVSGSSALQLRMGLSESLAGRFEKHLMQQWEWSEMREAFGLTLNQYLCFGGYPGAGALVSDEERWKSYVRQSLVESALEKDVLSMSRIEKPALIRAVFWHACEMGGQIVSFNKMLVTMQDAGNTTTLAHYLQLLSVAGLAVGISKWTGSELRQRGSSPKLIALDPSLFFVARNLSSKEFLAHDVLRGRYVENAVGALLWRFAQQTGSTLCYWNDGVKEVDFVFEYAGTTMGIEVKSGEKSRKVSGLADFKKRFPKAKILLIGAEGIPLETVFSSSPGEWLRLA
jgi:predicted AAA+ superfamily ATPase